MNEKQVLILGVGNILLSDEGVGVHVVQRLKQMDLPPCIEVVDGGTGGFELIDHVRGKTKVIIVDCMMLDADPGAVFRLTPDELFLRSDSPFSAHQGGIRELLYHITTLPQPPEVVVYGIVPLDRERPSMRLSEPVACRVSDIINAVLAEVEKEEVKPA